MESLAFVRSDVITAIAIFTSILAFFAWLDKHASEEAKASISEWLLAPRQVQFSIAETFGSLFALVYGKKILSIFGFFRSALVTSVVCIVIAIIWVISDFRGLFFSADNPTGLYLDAYWFSPYDVAENLLFYLIAYSIPADYMALLVSSAAIKKSAASIDIQRSVAFLVLGFFACFIIYFFALVVLLTMQPGVTIWLSEYPGDEGLKFYFEMVWEGLAFSPLIIFSPGSGPSAFVGNFGPFAYSTFFVLAWYVLFIVTAIALKALMWAARRVSFLTWLFDIKKYPVTCIGVIAAVIVSTAYAIFSFI
jgi:hypothetical protein